MSDQVEGVIEAVKHDSLDAAIHAVMTEIDYIQRKKVATLSYKVVTEADVIALIRPQLVKNRLILKPIRMKVVKADTIEKSSAKGTSIVRFVQVRYKWKISHIDSKQAEEVEVGGEAMDYGDKALPKALTIATKYLLRHLFLLETGDDPDTTPSESYAGDNKKSAAPPKPANNLFASIKAAFKTVTNKATLDRYYADAKQRPLTKDEMSQVTALYTTRSQELSVPDVDPDDAPEAPTDGEEY